MRFVDLFSEARRNWRGALVQVTIRLVRRISLGYFWALGIGIVDVLLMLPLPFPDKRAALLGAFCARFALGFFAATVTLPSSPVVTGVLVGVLTSLPDAIITKAYAQIMVTGVVLADRWLDCGSWAKPI